MRDYMPGLLTLRIFSNQVANYTHRAFVLRLNLPANLIDNGDSFYGFFLPEESVSLEDSVTVTKGFDILLGNSNQNEIAANLNGQWHTLAFGEDVRTKADMLNALLAIDTSKLNTQGKNFFYGAILALAKQLQCEDIVAKYTKLL